MAGKVPMLREAIAAAARKTVLKPAYDFVVAGGGIIGVNMASVIKQRHPDASVLVLDKEPELAMHASGRNSGVLHAGFYYSPGGLKARLTRQGNQFLHGYIEEKGLQINNCGKLVVAQSPGEVEGLEELLRRGEANDVPLERVTLAEARELEPLVKSHEFAIWSPTTAAADPTEVTLSLAKDAVDAGIDFKLGTGVRSLVGESAAAPRSRADLASQVPLAVSEAGQPLKEGEAGASLSGMHRYKAANPTKPVVVETDAGMVECGHFVNCAGLYADRLAHQMGFGQGLQVLPFKGLYLYCTTPLKRLIYPVPNLEQPFLGVHLTVTVDGKCKIGPTAIPAFWREQYHFTDNFKLDELLETTLTEAGLAFNNKFGFNELALQEMQKYYKPWMARGAAALAEGVTDDSFTEYGKAGIRAQMVDLEDRSLVMDFLVEGDERVTHVLNAVSPAWTCSRPFANFVCQAMDV